MMNELDIVVLKHDFPDNSLREGDIGTVVHCYEENTAFEVEFVTAAGDTIALLTLKPEDIRPMAGREVLHAREIVKMAM